ncbi:hypothetical protein M8C21_030632 [Ambrosia artemisiifolia]|uniref:BLOC-1-related complex subunit 6 C-terminal helix domain-containing protein n=1 Tax=Ambrosia artemisiifolia TaxID=4212 RepID=A0AAD5G5E0_AMBAR|nr:hypothetical protein M8C21_030632 [Ambrosia artemisiifolia]
MGLIKKKSYGTGSYLTPLPKIRNNLYFGCSLSTKNLNQKQKTNKQKQMEATNSETLDHNSQLPQQHNIDEDNTDTKTRGTEDPLLSSSMSQTEILRAVEVVERNSIAISDSFSSLFASLRLALSQVTSRSVDHVECFNEAAGRLQESALDSATKGNLYINSCLRLNEEMRGIDALAMQLNVDALDTAVNSLVRLH